LGQAELGPPKAVDAAYGRARTIDEGEEAVLGAAREHEGPQSNQ